MEEIAKKSQHRKEAYDFLCVLCGCLSENSKNLLLDLGVEFQIQYPRFDYSSYVRVLNLRHFNESIKKKFITKKHEQVTEFTEYTIKRQLLEKELYLLIISHSPAIKYFKVDFISKLDHPLLNFPGAHTSFSKLNGIYFDLKRLPPLFLGDLANISKNIQQIHILNFIVDEYGLAKLIKAQSGITHLHLESEGNCDGSNINKELEVHASSLKHFIMESPSLISATSLDSCIGIETLKLDTKGLERWRADPTTSTISYESFMNTLAAARFPHLRNLHLRMLGYCPTSVLKVAENLVARSEGQIHNLFLHGVFKKEQVKPTLLQNIAKHCPKLKYLSVWITNNDDLRHLEQILSSCPLLKGIIINTFANVRINGDELLKLLGRRLSRKLCKFKFDDNLNFSLSPFTNFMDCWNKAEPLYIHVIDATVFGFEYERVGCSFNKRGILKSFIEVDEFTSFSWDNVEGSDLLNHTCSDDQDNDDTEDESEDGDDDDGDDDDDDDEDDEDDDEDDEDDEDDKEQDSEED